MEVDGADLVFASLSEMVERADGPERGRGGRSSRRGDVSFCGTKSWDECKEVALAGYDDLRPMVDELVPAVLDGLDACEQTEMLPLWDLAGGAVDIGRFLSGEPECMVDFSMQDVPADRLVRVLVASTVSAATRKEDILKRGATVVALVEALVRAKYSVELWVENSVSAGYRGRGFFTILTRVKGAEEPLDINGFMFAAAHPSFLRRVAFGVQETVPVRVRDRFGFKHGGGYGSAPYRLRCASAIGAHVTVDDMESETGPVREPLAWLRAQIRRIQQQGVSVQAA